MKSYKNYNPEQWKFDDLSIPKEVVSEDQIQKIAKSFVDDLKYLEKSFKKSFEDRRAKNQIQTDDLRYLVDKLIRYNNYNNKIDVSRLSKFISPSDYDLYKDVMNFLQDFFKGKPQSILTLVKFKGMVVWYLSYVGF